MSKKPLRFYFALVCGKLSVLLLKLLRKNGTNFPGQTALTLCPDFLKHLEKPEKIIAVTGTNGKTTTSNMILDILTDNGYNCTNNNFGGNVDTGITAALLKDSTLSGKAKNKYCILEVDERSAVRVFPYVHPTYLICTNLTRDSYKRNAHSEYIFSILDKSIPDSTHLILNCDDMISSRLKKDNKHTFFGMENLEGELLIDNNIIKDIRACPICSSPLRYSFLRYNHIGRAKCSNCDFKSFEPDFDMISRTFTNDGHADITVKTPDGNENYTVPCENTIALYNALTAITVLRTFGLSHEQIQNSFQKISIVKSRFDVIEAKNKKVISMMSKGQNPVACSHSCNIIRNDPSDKQVILITDDFYDAAETSETIAWLYDTDYEFLNNDKVKKIIVGGKRHLDYILRLELAGISKDKIVCCEHEEDTAELVDISLSEKTYILFDMYNYNYSVKIKERLKERIENEN